MSPRLFGQQLRVFHVGGARYSIAKKVPLCLRLASQRGITANEKPLPRADDAGPGPNQNQLGHVSEEAAATDRITGDKGPDLDQGTPVQEVCIWRRQGKRSKSTKRPLKVLGRDETGKGNAPQVLQDSVKPINTKGSREFSTYARRMAELTAAEIPDSLQPEDIFRLTQPPIKVAGHKFGLPELPIPARAHLKHRYDPVVQQVTNLLMQHGKLSVAQKVRSSCIIIWSVLSWFKITKGYTIPMYRIWL